MTRVLTVDKFFGWHRPCTAIDFIVWAAKANKAISVSSFPSVEFGVADAREGA
jgi:hypothetical protein